MISEKKEAKFQTIDAAGLARYILARGNSEVELKIRSVTLANPNYKMRKRLSSHLRQDSH